MTFYSPKITFGVLGVMAFDLQVEGNVIWSTECDHSFNVPQNLGGLYVRLQPSVGVSQIAHNPPIIAPLKHKKVYSCHKMPYLTGLFGYRMHSSFCLMKFMYWLFHMMSMIYPISIAVLGQNHNMLHRKTTNQCAKLQMRPSSISVTCTTLKMEMTLTRVRGISRWRMSRALLMFFLYLDAL